MEVSTAIKNLLVDTFTANLDSGLIKIYSSDSTPVLLATCTFGNPAFAPAADGVATANAITGDDSAANGYIASASLYNASNVKVADLTVSLTGHGGDITAASLNVATDETIDFSSFTVRSV